MLVGSRRRLLRVCGDERALAALATFQADLIHILRTRLADRPVLSNWEALEAYLRAQQAHLSTESVRVLFLNTKNRLIGDEEHARGDIDHAQVSVRGILNRALELDAAALILSHNHPSGDASPSKADILLTHRLAKAGEAMGITLHDHVIVAASGTVSMRTRGLL